MSLFEQEECKIREHYAQRSSFKHLYHWYQPDEYLRLMELQDTLARMLRRLDRLDLSDLDALDVGCGTGGWLRKLLEWGADPARVHGIDLVERHIDMARKISCAEL